jgi:hypothetical protein
MRQVSKKIPQFFETWLIKFTLYCSDTFITECLVIAAPSTEKFKVDLTKFDKKSLDTYDEDENEQVAKNQ